MTTTQLSFLPEDYVERRKEQRTNLICLSLFGVVLIGVVGAYLVTMRQRADVRQQRTAVNHAYAEAAKRLEQLEKLQQQRAAMLRKAEITRTLVEPVPRTFLLADLINRMPATLSLFECSFNSKNITPPPSIDSKKSAMANAQKPAKPPEPATPRTLVTVSLVGVAPTDVQVAQYMSQLARSQLVADVNLVYSEETKINESFMRKFRIDMTLNEKADVRTIQPLLVERKIKHNPMQSDSVTALPAGKTGDPVVGRTKAPTGSVTGRSDSMTTAVEESFTNTSGGK
jgi:Tfp pilus assembly protein PilN